VPCALGEAAAIEDVRKVEELALIESDGGDVEIMGNGTGHVRKEYVQERDE
jgi:hypothetical protein